MTRTTHRRRRKRGLTPRGKALRRATRTRGITEQPFGSNSDYRRDGIRAWQIRCANGSRYLIGAPWCGVRCHDLLRAASVRHLGPYLASVYLIQQYAKKHRGCFRGWTTDYSQVFRGDLVTLFNGKHVEMVRKVVRKRVWRRGGRRVGAVLYVITEGGNTSSANRGSQSNGGGCFRRVRYPFQIDGFALVNYPG